MQQFNTTRHDFEITLENQTQIEVVGEDAQTQAIPKIQYHVRSLPIVASSDCLHTAAFEHTLQFFVQLMMSRAQTQHRLG